ncbi:hypothetical protein ACJJTC_004562 [Scirpophaga incertulas]
MNRRSAVFVAIMSSLVRNRNPLQWLLKTELSRSQISRSCVKLKLTVVLKFCRREDLHKSASSWNMGICLDTEQKHEELETTGGASRIDSAWAGRATPPTAAFPMQNSSHVKFEPPNVPVIFVLGGPGSGKVTHCDNLMQERRGMVHINMTDLLQQYAIGNGTADSTSLHLSLDTPHQ